jgi:hypothetical protein
MQVRRRNYGQGGMSSRAHTVSITADPDYTVTNNVYSAHVEAAVPNLNIIYPILI